MKNPFARWAGVCAALLLWSASAQTADQQHHILWSLQGKTNKVYLLGSVHLLKENEKLPAAIDTAYADAEKLVMEIDMDDLDPAQMQQDVMDLAALPASRPPCERHGAGGRHYTVDLVRPPDRVTLNP